MTAQALPLVAAIDTNVFLRFLLEVEDTKSEMCIRFCNAMLSASNTLVVAAPTLAEIGRTSGKPVPHTPGIEAIAFDQAAADVLAQRIPFSKLIELRDETGLPLHYWKYDSLILACAVRAKADCLVTTDTGLRKLATKIQFAARAPDEFVISSQVGNRPVSQRSIFDLFAPDSATASSVPPEEPSLAKVEPLDQPDEGAQGKKGS